MSNRITDEQQSVMDAISHTIEMLTQAPLTTVSDSVESEP